jgi:Heat induced stress protein YflT domain
MSTTSSDQTPIRAGVFSTVADAKRAVERLLAAGFPADEVSVVCSDHSKEAWFREFNNQEPAGTFTPKAAIAGGTAGAIIGSLSVLASAVATGSAALWMAGPIFTLAGGAAGGLIGAMSSRGVEKELANYYQQAVLDGDILVAVDEHDSKQSRLLEASEILSASGAKPLALREG